jgi:hypothetical protein
MTPGTGIMALSILSSTTLKRLTLVTDAGERAAALALQIPLCDLGLAGDQVHNGAIGRFDTEYQFVGAAGNHVADGAVVADDHVTVVHNVLHNLIKFVWHIRHDPYVEAFSSFHKR